MHTVLRADLVCWPTLFPFTLHSKGSLVLSASLDVLVDEATPRVALFLAGARRRNNGIPLCADACLLIAGPSHDKGQVNATIIRLASQCPGTAGPVLKLTGGIFFLSLTILTPAEAPCC